MCIDDQAESIITLSRPSPILPNEGIIPDGQILFVKANEVSVGPMVGMNDPAGFGPAFCDRHVGRVHDEIGILAGIPTPHRWCCDDRWNTASLDPGASCTSSAAPGSPNPWAESCCWR